MKTKILSLITILAMSLGLFACSEDWNPNGNQSSKKKGQISLTSLSVDVKHVESEVGRATVDVSNFIVKIYNAEGALVNQFRYGQMPEILTLAVGDYNIKVYSHEIAKAEWDHPYYEGTKNFTIVENEITEIGVVTCRFASLKVSVRFTEAFRAVMGDDVRVTVVANDEGSLEFTPAETRSGYYEVVAGSTTLVATFRGSLKNSYNEFNESFTDVAPGQHRIITYDVKNPDPVLPPEFGYVDPVTGIAIEISVTDVDISGGIDNSEDVIDGPQRPSEDPVNPPVDPDTPDTPDTPTTPTITAESATLVFWTAENPQFSSTDADPAKVRVHSDDGIAHFVVSIDSSDSNFVQAVGEVLSTSFDLAYPIAKNAENEEVDLTEALRDSFKFPVRDQVIGAHDLDLDISAFVPLLNGFQGIHTFTLTITDSKGIQLVKVLKFKVD